MKKLLVTLLMLIMSPVWADEYSGEKTHNIGFTLGSSHGSGIHYARQHADGWGIQITGFPLWVAEERILNAGFATIYNINKGKKGRVFASFGLGYSYRRSEWNKRNSRTGRDEVQIDEGTYYFFGPGLLPLRLTLFIFLLFKNLLLKFLTRDQSDLLHSIPITNVGKSKFEIPLSFISSTI